MKKYLLGFILIVLMAASAIWWFARETTLADLQKQYALTKTDADRAKVVDRLEEYYLNLAVPDTLIQRVEREAAAQMDTTTINLNLYSNGALAGSDVYHLESQLQNLLVLAAIARGRKETQTFQAALDQARSMAKDLDQKTTNVYWVPFVEEVNAFSNAKAITWLKARRASWLAWAYQDSTNKFTAAEEYAALGLKLLQRVEDERTRLDIMQRLQRILYFHRSMNSLSLALAEAALSQAEKMKYQTRAIGILYHQANVHKIAGRNQEALAPYDSVITRAKRFEDASGMVWFVKSGLLGKGKVLLELGETEKALEICQETEKFELNHMEKIALEILRASVYSSVGDYESAEQELQNAKQLSIATRDTVNRIICLNHLGILFQKLGDYDLALDYYEQAESFLAFSYDLNTKMLVYQNIANIAVGKKDSTRFEEITQKLQNLTKLEAKPFIEAQWLHGIALLYQDEKDYAKAIPFLQKADSLFTASGYLHTALLARFHLANRLIGLSRLHEAKTLLTNILESASKSDDVEIKIYATGSLAQASYKEGDFAGAANIAAQLTVEIEAMSKSFHDAQQLLAYRQNTYDILKNAVLYEISLKRFEDAYAKLDYAKAYELKSKLLQQYQDSVDDDRPANVVARNLDRQSVIIDYMLTHDTLYAFVLGHQGLRLAAKSIDMVALKKRCGAYQDSIQKTQAIFRHYNARAAKKFYAGTAALSQTLYQDLLGWPELQSLLQEAELLYIIPDEFLYELPFATLLTPNATAQSFVVHHAATAVLPSARFIQPRLEAPIAEPSLQKKVLLSVDSSLPGAEAFIVLVKKLLPLTEELTITGDRFSKEEILAQLAEQYDVYIFVGHGVANQKYPEQSFIEVSLTAAEGLSPRTMRLSLSDLKGVQRLKAEMVVLVGCETASGKRYRGTGALGLHQGFLSLGARNVVGNLWEIDASQAIAQAQDFIRAWVATGNASQALRNSQLNAIRKLAAHDYFQKPYPYFWGSPVLLTAQLQ